jgi:DNA-binding CsgD family transcriptional regulator
MSNESIKEALKNLTENEIKVLSLKCEDLQYVVIAERLGYSVEWVQFQMTNVYIKLGFEKKVHWTKRVEILHKVICPALADLQVEEVIEEMGGIKEEIIEEPQKEPDPEYLAIVLYDEKKELEEVKKKVKEEKYPIIEIKEPRRFPWRAVIILFLIFLVAGSGGFLLARMGQATPLPPTPIPSPVAVNSDTPLPSSTPSPTETSLPTNTPQSTDTPQPTNTVIPTPTGNYENNFSGGLEGLNVIFGKPVIVNGALTASEATLLSIGDETWKNYEVRFDVTTASYMIDPNAGDFIGVRVTDMSNMLLYAFGSIEGRWYNVENGDWVVVPGTDSGMLNDYIPAKSHFRVIVNENQIILYIGMRQITTFTNDDHPTGYVMLRIHAESMYDNFQVERLP